MVHFSLRNPLLYLLLRKAALQLRRIPLQWDNIIRNTVLFRNHFRLIQLLLHRFEAPPEILFFFLRLNRQFKFLKLFFVF